MTKAEQHYRKIASDIEQEHGIISGQMFGKPCLKYKKKAFAAFYKDCMVFKMPHEDAYRQAIGLDGAKLWDPSGKGRAMKKWIQVPYEYEYQWKDLADSAFHSNFLND